MLEPMSEMQKKRIVNNIVKACRDIQKLSRAGYNYIYLACGFIAHYDINGFKHHYTYHSLKEDILSYQSENQWDNFSPGEENYEYYRQKAEIYNEICKKIRKVGGAHYEQKKSAYVY